MEGQTAVWVSDTHLGQVRKDGFARQIAAQIKCYGGHRFLLEGFL